LPVLVFATMWLQQKLMTPPAQTDNKKKGQNDNPAAAMSKSMQTTMPLMFGFFSLSFPSGLSIYFVLANIIGIGQGYYTRRITQQEKEKRAAEKSKLPPPSSADKAISESASSGKSSSSKEKSVTSSNKSKSRRRRKSARR